MEFVDNTGHIFSLPSYNEKPIGYEYDEYSYVFWIDSNNTSKLSVNNFYLIKSRLATSGSTFKNSLTALSYKFLYVVTFCPISAK